MGSSRVVVERFVAAGLIALAGWLLAPPPVSAACGDYVTIAGQEHGKAMNHHLPTMPKPCHGPGCSQGVPVAPIVPAAPAPAVKQVMMAILHLVESPGPATGLDLQSSLDGHDGHLASIFHPPR